MASDANSSGDVPSAGGGASSGASVRAGLRRRRLRASADASSESLVLSSGSELVYSVRAASSQTGLRSAPASRSGIRSDGGERPKIHSSSRSTASLLQQVRIWARQRPAASQCAARSVRQVPRQ